MSTFKAFVMSSFGKPLKNEYFLNEVIDLFRLSYQQDSTNIIPNMQNAGYVVTDKITDRGAYKVATKGRLHIDWKVVNGELVSVGAGLYAK